MVSYGYENKTLGSLIFPLTDVIGRLIINCFPMQCVVRCKFFFIGCFLRTFYIAVFIQDPKIISQAPTQCGAAGGLKDHLILFSVSCVVIASSVCSLNTAVNSLAAPTKFVPLSDSIILGCPLPTLNLCTASRQASVSKLDSSHTKTNE